MTVDVHSANVFDLALPPIAHHDATDPDEAHRQISQARRQSPIALGPYGPELLTYDLVRTVLRDSRFAMPQGIGLMVQGITSGPVWDRVCRLLISLDGPEHHRLRRLVSRAFTPRAAERMRAACVMSSPSWSTNTRPRGAATWSPTSRSLIRSRSSVRCWALPEKTGDSSRCGLPTSARPSGAMSPRRSRPSCGRGSTSTLILWS